MSSSIIMYTYNPRLEGSFTSGHFGWTACVFSSKTFQIIPRFEISKNIFSPFKSRAIEITDNCIL